MNWTVVKICSICDGIIYIGMTEEDYKFYITWAKMEFIPREQLMYTLFPHLPKEVREVLISDIHPQCVPEYVNA